MDRPRLGYQAGGGPPRSPPRSTPSIMGRYSGRREPTPRRKESAEPRARGQPISDSGSRPRTGARPFMHEGAPERVGAGHRLKKKRLPDAEGGRALFGRTLLRRRRGLPGGLRPPPPRDRPRPARVEREPQARQSNHLPRTTTSRPAVETHERDRAHELGRRGDSRGGGAREARVRRGGRAPPGTPFDAATHAGAPRARRAPLAPRRVGRTPRTLR